MPEQHPAVRDVVERGGGHGGHRRGAAGHLEDRRADLDPLGVGREPGEHGGGVGAVGLGGPDGVEARGLRLAHDLELLLGGEAEPPVPNVQTQAACKSPFSRRSDLEVARRPALPWAGPGGDGHRMSPIGRGLRDETSTRPARELRTAIDCMPLDTRVAMLDAVAAQPDHRRRLHRPRRRRVPDAGRPPQRRAAPASPASPRAWDRYTGAVDGARRATEREVRTLEHDARASIAAEDERGDGVLENAIGADRTAQISTSPARRARGRSRRRRSGPGAQPSAARRARGRASQAAWTTKD